VARPFDAVRTFPGRLGPGVARLAADVKRRYLCARSVSRKAQAGTHVVRVPARFHLPGPDLRFHRAPQVCLFMMGTGKDRLGCSGNRATPLTALWKIGTPSSARDLRPWRNSLVRTRCPCAARFSDTPYPLGRTVRCWANRLLRPGTDGAGHDRQNRRQRGFRSAGSRSGAELDPEREWLQRGDLVFWKGHSLLSKTKNTLLQRLRSAPPCMVTREPLCAKR